MNNYKSLIVISSPSGGGKSTIAKHLMKLYPSLDFSVSATTRKKRDGEINNKDYFFLSKEEFLEKIEKNDLIEYEEIFGNLYGTLKSEVSKSIDKNKTILFDVDVKGALSLKKHFPNQTLLIFIAPPNFEVLEDRLRKRRTETEDEIKRRLDRAEEEDKYRDKFDELIINDNLNESFRKIEAISNKHLNPELKQKG